MELANGVSVAPRPDAPIYYIYTLLCSYIEYVSKFYIKLFYFLAWLQRSSQELAPGIPARNNYCISNSTLGRILPEVRRDYTNIGVIQGEGISRGNSSPPLAPPTVSASGRSTSATSIKDRTTVTQFFYKKNCGESAISLWEICFFFKKQLFFIKTALTGPLVYPRGRDPQGRRQRLKSIIKLNVEEFDCRRKNSRALPGTEYQTGLRELPNRVSVAPWYSTEQSVGC
jgi:hypothetical protein